MIYAAGLISAGICLLYAGGCDNVAEVSIFGAVLYIIGMFFGNLIEERTEDKIKKLEKEIKELKENGKGNTL